MKKIKLLLLLIIVVGGQLLSQPIPTQIDKIVDKYYEAGQFNGSILVAENNTSIYQNSVGFAHTALKIPNTTDTRFMIGSCTKQFTAALILLFKEEGKLALTDPISKYIPDYPSEKGDKITIHHLLSHTSGIPGYLEIPEIKKLMYTENKPIDIIKNFRDLDLDFESGTQFKYSNSGYYVLGQIIENVSDKTYEQVLEEKIFNPLGMKNSGVYQNSNPPKKMATGCNTKEDTIRLAPPVNATVAYAAGALYSTINDLQIWEDALVNNTLLSKESVALMTTPHTEHYGYGFGLVTIPTNNKPVNIWGHEGEFFGFRSLMHVLDNGRFFIVLLDNHEDPGLMKMANEIRNILYADE